MVSAGEVAVSSGDGITANRAGCKRVRRGYVLQCPDAMAPSTDLIIKFGPAEVMVLVSVGVQADRHGQVTRTMKSWRYLESVLLQKGHRFLANRIRELTTGSRMVEARL